MTKNNYFEVRHNIDEFSGIEISSTSSKEWQNIKWVKPIGKRKHRLPDFSSYNGSYLYAKLAQVNALSEIFREIIFIENFPFEDDYYQVHAVKSIKGLIDFSKSKVEFYEEGNLFGFSTGKISRAVKVKFKKDVKELLFCPEELYGTGVYCDDHFKNFVEENNLNGLVFVPINKLGTS